MSKSRLARLIDEDGSGDEVNSSLYRGSAFMQKASTVDDSSSSISMEDSSADEASPNKQEVQSTNVPAATRRLSMQFAAQRSKLNLSPGADSSAVPMPPRRSSFADRRKPAPPPAAAPVVATKAKEGFSDKKKENGIKLVRKAETNPKETANNNGSFIQSMFSPVEPARSDMSNTDDDDDDDDDDNIVDLTSYYQPNQRNSMQSHELMEEKRVVEHPKVEEYNWEEKKSEVVEEPLIDLQSSKLAPSVATIRRERRPSIIMKYAPQESAQSSDETKSAVGDRLNNNFQESEPAHSIPTTCSVSWIGQVLDSGESESSHALFKASLAQSAEEIDQAVSNDVVQKGKGLAPLYEESEQDQSAAVEVKSPERVIKLPPNIVAKGNNHNQEIDDVKEAMIKRKVRRETLVAYEIADPDCTGILGRDEFILFMDAMGFALMSDKTRVTSWAHSINERSFKIATELSKLADTMNQYRKEEERVLMEIEGQNNIPFSSNSNSNLEKGSGSPHSRSPEVSPLMKKSVGNSAKNFQNQQNQQTPLSPTSSGAGRKRNPGRMTMMESTVKGMFKPNNGDIGSADKGAANNMIEDVNSSKKNGNSMKRGSFFGLYTKTSEATASTANAQTPTLKNVFGSMSPKNSQSGTPTTSVASTVRGKKVNLSFREISINSHSNLLSSGVTLEGAAWFSQIVFGIDYFDDPHLAKLVEEIKTNMKVHRKAKASSKYLKLSEPVSDSPIKSPKFVPKEGISYYGLYDEESLSPGANRRRDRWEKALQKDAERFEEEHPFSPTIRAPPLPGVGDVVEVDATQMDFSLLDEAEALASGESRAHIEDWKDAVIVAARSDADGYIDHIDGFVDIKIAGSPDVKRVPESIVRARSSHRKTFNNTYNTGASGGSPRTADGLNFNSTVFRRVDLRTSEERIMEDHCTFQPKSYVHEGMNSSIIKNRAATMSDGLMGAMYSHKTGLTPGPPNAIGIPLVYYDGANPPSWQTNTYVQQTDVEVSEEVPIEVETMVEVEVPSGDAAGSSVETMTGDIPLAPPMPDWAWLKGGDPDRKKSKAGGGRIAPSTQKKAPPAAGGGNVMSALMQEMQNKFKGMGKSNPISDAIDKPDKKEPKKLGGLPKKKKRRGAKDFTGVIDELSYTLAKMRGEIVEDDDDEESEEEEEVEEAPKPKFKMPAPPGGSAAKSPAAPGGLASLFGAVTEEEAVIVNNDKHAMPLISKAPVPPPLPREWEPEPYAPVVAKSEEPKSPKASGKGNANGPKSPGRKSPKKTQTQKTIVKATKTVTSISTQRLNKPLLTEAYYMIAPAGFEVVPGGVMKYGQISSSLCKTLAKRWKKMKAHEKSCALNPNGEAVDLPADYYEGIERLRKAKMARWEEDEIKRLNELREFNPAEYRKDRTGVTVPREFFFHCDSRKNNKTFTYRKPAIDIPPANANGDDDEQVDIYAEHEVQTNHGAYSEYGGAHRRSSHAFVHGLRNTQLMTEDEKKVDENKHMADKPQFQLGNARISKTALMRKERKQRELEKEKDKEWKEKERKKALLNRSRGTYCASSQNTSRHPHEKILLNYSNSRPDIVEATLDASRAYSHANNESGHYNTVNFYDSEVKNDFHSSHYNPLSTQYAPQSMGFGASSLDYQVPSPIVNRNTPNNKYQSGINTPNFRG